MNNLEQAEMTIPPEFWKGKTILLVDDDEEILYLEKRIFGRTGARILTANNGQEALALIKQLKKEDQTADLVLTDFNMPEIQGDELARQIRAQADLIRQPTIIIASGNEFTGVNSAEVQQRLTEMGADIALKKPFENPRGLPNFAARLMLSK